MTGLAQRLNPPSSVPLPGTHLGLRWRLLIPSDAPQVFALCQRTQKQDEAIRWTTTDDVANMVEGRHGSDFFETIVGIDSENNIVAVAWVQVLRSVDDAAIALVGAVVDPRWRGRGVGRSLLFWQDGRARQLLVELYGPDSQIPASIANFVDSHMTDRRRLHIAAGFSAKRTFQLMYREIEGSEMMPHIPSDYRLLPFADVPVDEVRRVHMDAFLDHYRPALRGRWWEEALSELDPRWSWVLLGPNDEVAAYCLTGRPSAAWAATGRPEAYVQLLGVARDHRGRSLASLLLRASVASAAASGIPRIGLDVDTQSPSSAHAIYEHHGFVDEKAEVLYSIDM